MTRPIRLAQQQPLHLHHRIQGRLPPRSPVCGDDEPQDRVQVPQGAAAPPDSAVIGDIEPGHRLRKLPRPRGVHPAPESPNRFYVHRLKHLSAVPGGGVTTARPYMPATSKAPGSRTVSTRTPPSGRSRNCFRARNATYFLPPRVLRTSISPRRKSTLSPAFRASAATSRVFPQVAHDRQFRECHRPWQPADRSYRELSGNFTVLNRLFSRWMSFLPDRRVLYPAPKSMHRFCMHNLPPLCVFLAAVFVGHLSYREFLEAFSVHIRNERPMPHGRAASAAGRSPRGGHRTEHGIPRSGAAYG